MRQISAYSYFVEFALERGYNSFEARHYHESWLIVTKGPVSMTVVMMIQESQVLSEH